MKLYGSAGACSLAADIALHEAGIRFDLAKVDLRTKKVDGADFNEVNPKGYVPALRLTDGTVLTENVAVLQYIADLNPDAHLAPPAGTMERYRLQEWLGFISSELHKSFGPLFHTESGEQAQQSARAQLQKRLKWLQGELGSRPYLLGQAFTVADAYLFTVLRWAPRVGIDLAQWPALQSYVGRIGARAHVIEALTLEGLLKSK